MIEVRLFATFRQGREKVLHLNAKDHPNAQSILDHLHIPAQEVAILLINGTHSKPGDSVADGDVLALFPPVGGG